MSDLANLHDNALIFENEIEQSIDEIRELRLKMLSNKKPEVIKRIIPVLNCIINEAEEYKTWLEKV